MRKFENIIQSEITPSTNSLYLKDGALFYYNNGKWKPISSGPNAPNFVGCTEEEYNSLESKDSNTLYVINSNSGIDALYAGKNKVWKNPNRFKGKFSTTTNWINASLYINGEYYNLEDKVNPETREFDFEYDGDTIYDIQFYGDEDEGYTTFESIECLPDTSKVKSMSNMLSCSRLKTINLSSIDASNVISTSYMFEKCPYLQSIDLSGFDMSKVITTEAMFKGCGSLKKVDIPKGLLANVSYMDEMFYNSGLEEINTRWEDLTYFPNLLSMRNMFGDCRNLKSLNLTMKAPQLKDMSDMLSNCQNLESTYLYVHDAKPENLSGLFDGCTNLISIEGQINMSNTTNMARMFSNCRSLGRLFMVFGDTSKVQDMSYMFNGCSNLTNLSDIGALNTNQVGYMTGMFQGCESITNLYLPFDTTRNVVSFSYMFRNCSKLLSLTFNGDNFNMSKASCYGMFDGCTSLKNVEGPITGIRVSIDLSSCPLTRISAMVFINGLDTITTSQIITFSQVTYNTLSAEDIAIATNKGWTVAVN